MTDTRESTPSDAASRPASPARPTSPVGPNTTGNLGSLRSLLPRLFSRAQPAGAVDTLIRTVRSHHPKADVTLIERA